MNDRELENLFRSLKPAPLSEDLRERLGDEPERPQASSKRGAVVVGWSVAAAVAVFGGLVFFPSSDNPMESDPIADESDRPVSVVQKDSTLLSSRLLSIEEYDGELWEVSEQEWRDDTLVLYSGGPSKLNSTVIRREVVCAPLIFQ